jgi:5-methylcytosine-specific restriction endonuclease McrA
MALSYKEQIKHPNWQRKRLHIFQRDNFACTVCGNTEHQLQVHHLYYLPETLIWEYDDECYKTVCPKCHNLLNKEMPKLAGLLAWELLIGKKSAI